MTKEEFARHLVDSCYVIYDAGGVLDYAIDPFFDDYPTLRKMIAARACDMCEAMEEAPQRDGMH